MRSAREIEAIVREIEALTDKELIAEAKRHLRAAPHQMRRELKEQWNAMIAEASAVLLKRFARPGTKREARGRLRTFCRTRAEYA
jgi:hypothetical protein